MKYFVARNPNQAKVEQIEDILDAFEKNPGWEKMWEILLSKYGPEPTEENKASDTTPSGGFKTRSRESTGFSSQQGQRAEERRRVLEQLLKTAAVTIQRIFRGWSARARFLRENTEKLRANTERTTGAQLEKFRDRVYMIDTNRLKTEAFYLRWLESRKIKEKEEAAKVAKEALQKERQNRKSKQIGMKKLEERENELFKRIKEETRTQMAVRKQERSVLFDAQQERARLAIDLWEQRHQKQVRERWTREERARQQHEPLPGRERNQVALMEEPLSPVQTRHRHPPNPPDLHREGDDKFERLKMAWAEREDWMWNRESILKKDYEAAQHRIRGNEILHEMIEHKASPGEVERAYTSPIRGMTTTLTARQRALEEDFRRQTALHDSFFQGKR